MEQLANLFESHVKVSDTQKVLDSIDIQGIAKAIKQKKLKNIIVMVGAGISVSAGIPDFRSPKTGLYANLQKYDLPRPEAIFDIDFFRENPQPFCTLAKELYPGEYCPTYAHSFIKLLQDKGLLLRCYTQNIDGLEFLAGVDKEKVVQAHGGFTSAHCIECNTEIDTEYIKATVFNDEVPSCHECDGLVKPDIVFFGENLPARFHSLSAVDFKEADCLIVMGTSLGVQPFAGLIECVPETVPRLLINLEKVGESSGEVKEIKKLMRAAKNETEKAQYRFQLQMMKMFGMSARGFDFDTDENTTDVFLQSTCDQGVQDVTKLICSKYLEELLSIQHKLEDLFPDSTVKPSAAVPPLAETTRDGAKGKIASEVKSSNSNSKDPKIEDKVDANSSAIKKSSNANTIQEKPKKTEGVKKRVKKRVKKKGKKPFERK